MLEGSGVKRALIMSGAYPLRAVGFALAEAFGKAVDSFDPHPDKGKSPTGLSFEICRHGENQRLQPSLKIAR